MKFIKHLLLFIGCFIASIFLCMQIFDDILVMINVSENVYIIERIFLSAVLYFLTISIKNKEISKKYIDLLAGLYIICIISVTFLKGVYGEATSGLNLNPLQIINDFKLASNTSLLIIGNSIAYIPIGIYLNYKVNINEKKLCFIFILYSISIETVQFIMKIGSFDINDIILNSFGFSIGIILYKILSKREDKYEKNNI